MQHWLSLLVMLFMLMTTISFFYGMVLMLVNVSKVVGAYSLRL